jgi:serine/threonine-protein kinase HipA
MNCLCCHKDTGSDGEYHQKCLRDVFGVAYLPGIPFGVSDLPAKVIRVVGKMSISGVQMKASVKINRENKQLEMPEEGGTHILKPEPGEYPELPQNENLIMNMAKALKMKVPPHGLFRMADGKLCYIIKRFDRSDEGKKIHKEDMAQLLEFPPDNKYSGSLELIGNVIKKYAENPFLDLFEYFQRVVFNFVVGNGDMHLKNWSLITPRSGPVGLAPCYDFVDSKMYFPEELDSALTMGGKKNKWNQKLFMGFAEYLGVDLKAASNAINSIIKYESEFVSMTRASYLSLSRQEQLLAIMLERINRIK